MPCRRSRSGYFAIPTTPSALPPTAAICTSIRCTASRCWTAIAKIGASRRTPRPLPTATGYGARVQAGSTERYLYLYIEVDDTHFDPEPSNVHPERDRFDRVDLTLQRPDGTQESYFFATSAPGLIAAQSIVKGDDGQDRAVEEPRIQAFWLQTAAGYHVEARIPLSFVGSRLWIEAKDGRGSGKAGLRPPSTRRTAAGYSSPRPGLDELARHLHPRRHPRHRHRRQCPETGGRGQP